ncbi:MAG: hypothetical protein ACYC8T_06280 [Myxococcaceae bacterium]
MNALRAAMQAVSVEGDVVTERFMRNGHFYEVRYRVVRRSPEQLTFM